jgi:hypothetical protein
MLGHLAGRRGRRRRPVRGVGADECPRTRHSVSASPSSDQGDAARTRGSASARRKARFERVSGNLRVIGRRLGQRQPFTHLCATLTVIDVTARGSTGPTFARVDNRARRLGRPSRMSDVSRAVGRRRRFSGLPARHLMFTTRGTDCVPYAIIPGASDVASGRCIRPIDML